MRRAISIAEAAEVAAENDSRGVSSPPGPVKGGGELLGQSGGAQFGGTLLVNEAETELQKPLGSYPQKGMGESKWLEVAGSDLSYW